MRSSLEAPPLSELQFAYWTRLCLRSCRWSSGVNHGAFAKRGLLPDIVRLSIFAALAWLAASARPIAAQPGCRV
jgi:hypothetical protein